MFWLVLLGAILTLLHVYMRLLTRRTRSMVSHLPTYKCLPFIGNMYKFFGDGQNAFNFLENLTTIMEERRQPFVIWIGQCCFIILSDPEDARMVANNFLEKPYFYNFARLWLKDGLVTAPGSIWKHNVKKFAVAFSGSMVDDFLPIFNEQSRKLQRKLEVEVNCEPFDLFEKYLAYTTLETICQTALGEHDVTETIVTKEYYAAFNGILELIFSRALNIFLHPEFVYRLTPGYKEFKRCVSVVQNVSDAILRKRRKEMEEAKTAKISDSTNKENGEVKFKTFLDIILQMNDTDHTLTEEHIKAEIDTIILAGQETIATAINYIFLMLGCKPDVQQKLYKEIKEIFGESKRPVLKEDLSRLRYCEAIIYETLRLFPPVPGVLRQADRDIKLKSCTVPKGATCCISFWGSGHSKHIWGSDALQYKPERWLDPNVASMGATSLLTFSTGKRACIGKRYAVTLMKTVLVHSVREYEFVSEADKMELKIDIALRPISGHLLQVKSRSGVK
ncbi:unnamed protein product [Parnassius mnemosyne]|uniref:Cytochrome P450 n=1 Tax=Parnassius mnemosyne TaxID=213953 RepID=A0AAV1KXW5_9NEOP